MAAVRGGTAFDESAMGEAELTNERAEVSDEVMVGKAVRIPVSTVERVLALAAERGTTWSELVRRWIEEGLARDAEAGYDPFSDLSLAILILEQTRQGLRRRLVRLPRPADSSEISSGNTPTGPA